MRRIAAFGITAVLALGAVACSDDSGDDEESTDTTEASEPDDSVTTGTASAEDAEFCDAYKAAVEELLEASAADAGMDEFKELYQTATDAAPEDVAVDVAAANDAMQGAEDWAALISISGDSVEAIEATEEWIRDNCGYDPTAL